MKKIVPLLAALSLLAPAAFAEQAKVFDDIEVHYNAMSTDELLPEVAKSYDIARSKNRGLLTVSVHRKNKLGVPRSVKAKLKANAVNLSGQLFAVKMREVVEGTAIYYLGEYRVSPPETLKFTLSITPQGGKEPHKVEFDQEFYR